MNETCKHGVVIGSQAPCFLSSEASWDERGRDMMVEFYTACDCCDYMMANDSNYYYDEETGETLCGECEPKKERLVSDAQ